ncbi:hypothetical protein [Parafrankia sp. FMc2]|uniref:hypothetical protein n=1 Tax=Parafrankia sp. FMc2 TaxID=3233196 RepID=UPI0034D785EA
MSSVRVPSAPGSPSIVSRRVVVFDLLDAEWSRIVESSRLCAATIRWARVDPDLAGLEDPRELLAAAQDMTDQVRLARVVRALVRVASEDPGEADQAGAADQTEEAGDAGGTGGARPDPPGVEAGAQERQLAAQVLVHALLPALKALCARTWWMPRHPDGGSMWLLADHEERASVALELLLASIRGYRWRARRGPVNLGLLSDVRTRLVRLVAAAREADRPVHFHADLDVVAGARRGLVDEHAFYAEALIGLLRWARDSQVLTADAVRLVAVTRLDDRTPDELAAEQGARAHTVRRRRQRAEATLASAARAAGRWPLPEPVWA